MNTACVFSIDDAYVMPFQVFFHSLEQTGSIPHDVSIFILHTASLSDASQDRLRQSLRAYEREVTFLDATHLVPADLPIREGEHISPATFYRLFVADIIPQKFDYALYLDADMLALASIASLFTMDVHECLAAADHCNPANEIRLWGPEGGSYFQAGVLLIPLKSWREMNMANHFIEIMSSHRDEIRWWDQDVLNIAFCDRWQRLPIWFNVCQSVLRALPMSEVQNNTVLVHFTGSRKPWNSLSSSPFTPHWDRVYLELFGQPFDRSVFLPRRRTRLKAAVRSRIAGLIHGRP